MPYIVPNNLLTPTDKVIKPYNCAFIAVDGPQIKGKVNMEGLEMPYDSQYTSQMTLNESDTDVPIHYGFLGHNVTFLMIRAMYQPNDPNFEIEADQYIEYYFADDINTTRHIGKLMILSGNSLKRIPQIYLSNPNPGQKVHLEIFMANQSQSNSGTTGGNIFSNLYYNNVVSNVVVYSPTLTGSDSINITDISSDVQVVIPYVNINTIERTTDGSNVLIIGTDSESIQLIFLSEFNMLQAHSRINWVLESVRDRKLTSTSPSIDSIAPVVTWTDAGSLTGYTSLPWSGTTLSNDFLKEYYISGVTDNQDGEISIYDTELVVYRENDLVPLTNIPSEGQYTLYFTVLDIAGNTETHTKYGMVDTVAPVITFKTVATGITFSMSVSTNTVSGTYITTGDTLTYTVDSVSDNVYSGLTLSDVSIIITGDTCGGVCSDLEITNSGETYSVTYSLSDFVGNTATYNKTMNTIT